MGILVDLPEPELSHYKRKDGNKILHEHIIEPYLESILRPLNIIQNVFFCAKYKVRGRVIKPISRLYSAMSIIFYFILTLYLFCMNFMTENKGGMEIFEYFVGNVYHFVLFFIGGFVNLFMNIKQKYNNVLYVLKIQNVHRILKLNKRCFKRSITFNWICVITINFFHIYGISMYSMAYRDVNVFNSMASYANIRFDVNVIYAIRCLELMTESLKVWTSNLQKSTYYSHDSLNDSYWNAMFACYVDITEIFLIVETIFHPMVFFYLIHTCSNALIEIWSRVESRPIASNNELQYTLLSFTSLTWVIKNVLIITFLSVECEKYYSAIKEVENSCSQMTTSERSTANQKRFCKNILRVQGATFNALRVCGLFAVDASLPLRVIAFITTYTIVLLQFVFL